MQVKVSTQNEISKSLTCVNLKEGNAFYQPQNLLCNLVQEVKMDIAKKSNQSQLHAQSHCGPLTNGVPTHTQQIIADLCQDVRPHLAMLLCRCHQDWQTQPFLVCQEIGSEYADFSGRKPQDLLAAPVYIHCCQAPH